MKRVGSFRLSCRSCCSTLWCVSLYMYNNNFALETLKRRPCCHRESHTMRGACTESLHLIIGQCSEIRKNSLIGKHGEVVEKTLYKCINERLMHVAAWYGRSFYFIMAALRCRCGHYIFALWFLLSSIFFLSSPNLSRRRLDVYHTSTHGVALLRI